MPGVTDGVIQRHFDERNAQTLEVSGFHHGSDWWVLYAPAGKDKIKVQVRRKDGLLVQNLVTFTSIH